MNDVTFASAIRRKASRGLPAKSHYVNEITVEVQCYAITADFCGQGVVLLLTNLSRAVDFLTHSGRQRVNALPLFWAKLYFSRGHIFLEMGKR